MLETVVSGSLSTVEIEQLQNNVDWVKASSKFLPLKYMNLSVI